MIVLPTSPTFVTSLLFATGARQRALAEAKAAGDSSQAYYLLLGLVVGALVVWFWFAVSVGTVRAIRRDIQRHPATCTKLLHAIVGRGVASGGTVPYNASCVDHGYVAGWL